MGNAELTDVHLCLREPARSLAYPGPRAVAAQDDHLVQALLAQMGDFSRPDFVVKAGGGTWRGRHDKWAVDGEWVRLRRMPERPPTLDDLPSPLPAVVKAVLMSPKLTRGGGLIHIAGGPGCGKTTTGSAVVVSRLTAFGGIAYTVEDPPEMPLNGWHGEGYCTQTWVPGDTEEHWVEAMRGVLRSQPAATNLILYVGEVRDAATARAMLRAASNGFLVISTGFGSDLISGINTFFQLIGQEHADSFAHALRAIVHQKLDGIHLQVQVLVSESSASPVAVNIRNRQLAQLGTEIGYQRTQLTLGKPLL